VKRCDCHFELHRWQTAEWFTVDYVRWMQAQPKVFMIRPVVDIPNSVAYPKDAMVSKFGPWFFTSSVAWMMALAIERGAKEIGLWGIDMSHQSEWIYQRSGCHYFVNVAKAMGIRVTVPPESDLLRPPPLYGFCEVDEFNIKLQARKDEVNGRLQAAAHDERTFLQGAIDDIDYNLKTWVSDEHAISLAKMQPRSVDQEPHQIVSVNGVCEHQPCEDHAVVEQQNV
jgi:hypothetical protein